MNSLLSSFKALGDSTRLRIVAVLTAGPFNVNELVGILAMGQSRISRHLKILNDAGLVETRREGSWVYYSLAAGWHAGRPRPDDHVLSPLRKRLERERVAEHQAIAACYEARRQKAEIFFRDVARGWDAQRDRMQGPPDHLEQLVEQLDPCETVVDLGTGTGVLLPSLCERAKQVIGVDASAEMLQVARENAKTRGLENVDLRLGELEHLPLSDAEADAMVANMVLHHVANPPEALREIHRVLKPKGKLLIADFKAHEKEEYRETLGDLWLGFEDSELRHWLDEAELELEDYREMPLDAGRPPVLLTLARKRF